MNVDDCRFSLHLFAGAGGGILADVLSGRIVLGAVEVEEYQRLVLMRRILDGVLPNFPIWDDVRTFRMDNPVTADYIRFLAEIRGELCVCVEDFRARMCPLQEEVEDWMERSLDSGLSTSESLGRSDLGRSSSKTALCSELGDLTECSKDLPKQGMMLSGTVYRLPKLGRGINERGCGYVPTPTRRDYKGGHRPDFFKTASEKKVKKCESHLSDYVIMYPTPTTGGLAHATGSQKQIDDLKDKGVINDEERRSFRAGNGGQLNPDWVEGLMDWPYRWTDIEYSCNETFQLWKDVNRDLTVFDEEPPMARLAEPHPFRPARLKSIGNGQVPLCAHIAERLNDFIMQNRL